MFLIDFWTCMLQCKAMSPTERKSILPVQFYLERKLNFLHEVTDTINSYYIFSLLYFPMYSRCANRAQVIISLIIELSVPKITASSHAWKQLQGHEFGVIHNSIIVRNLVRKVFWQDSLSFVTSSIKKCIHSPCSL